MKLPRAKSRSIDNALRQFWVNSMMIIRARAPLRLGLAGGGTDVSPYCDIYGGYVLNATIDRYAYAVIKTLDEPVVRFVATDQQTEEVTAITEPLVLNGKLDLHKAVYSHMVQHFNGGKPIPMELSTFCDAPAGSGLGSSSTLVVVMIRAFAELLNLPLDDYTIAHLAYQIERVDCALQGGRQDHECVSGRVARRAMDRQPGARRHRRRRGTARSVRRAQRPAQGPRGRRQPRRAGPE